MSKRVTDSEFRKRVNQKYGNQFTVVSDYHGMNSKVKIRCNLCNWSGKVKAANFLNKNYGSKCPIHGKRQLDSSNFQKLINQKQNNQYTLLSGFTNFKTKVKIKCNKCEKNFYVWPEDLLCKRFGKNCKHAVKLDFKQASKQLNQISNGEIKLVHFSGMKSVATFEHLKCGNFWRAKASHVFNDLRGCPTCSSSKGEKAVIKYLKKKGYHFEPQFRIETCKDRRTLPFDFAVFNKDRSLNCLIEYQGCQHFMDPSQFNKKGSFSEESVSRTQKHDAMKLSFCKEHGIKLIRINHPQNTGESNKHSFIANLVKHTLDKELKVS